MFCNININGVLSWVGSAKSVAHQAEVKQRVNARHATRASCYNIDDVIIGLLPVTSLSRVMRLSCFLSKLTVINFV